MANQRVRADSGENSQSLALVPYPAYELAYHVAQREEHRSPNESRAEVRNLEFPHRHSEDAGDQWNRGAQRSKKAADKDRKRPPALHKCLAPGQQFGVARQRPDMCHRRSELHADPIREPIAERSAHRTGDPNRPEIEIPVTDQDADSHQRSPGRNEQGNECKRLAEGESKNYGRRPRLMVTHKLHHVLGVGFEALEHMGGGPVTGSVSRGLPPDASRPA